MQRKIAETQVCPACNNRLTLIEFISSVEEITCGVLKCRPCRKNYPIIQGETRFIPQKDNSFFKKLLIKY